MQIESATVGLAIIDGTAVAIACDGEVEGLPHIVAWQTIQASSPSELQNGLKQFVDQNGLQGWNCRCALAPTDYSLRLVERPANIPDEELVDATRWLVRDLIEFDVEQAGLTILTIPEDDSRARTQRMFVVAAKHEEVLDLAHTIKGAGLELLGFEIVESAMLALDARLPEVVAGSASLRIDEKASVLTLSHAHHLYLARNLNVDSDTIETAAQNALNDPSPSNSDVVELLDPLLLDIQRSLDYYESEYGQAGASRISLLPSQSDLTPLLPVLLEAFRPIQVEVYDLLHHFEFDDQPPTATHPQLAIAVGAAIANADLIGNALLPPSFRRASGGLGLGSVLKVVGATAAVLAVYCGVSWFFLEQERAALAALEAQQVMLSEQVETLRADAEIKASSAGPISRVDSLRASRDSRLALLRDLGQQSSRSDASFSTLLSGLARQDVPGVWLERITFSEGGDSIAIEGLTVDAEDVPVFLRRLGVEPSFEGRNFRTFEISRPPSSADRLGFRIATRGVEDSTTSEAP